MDYWSGFMDWTVNKDWVCEICGEYKGMTWGLPHALCRCNNCHAQYTMRDSKDNVVDIPISIIKEEYKEPAKIGYKKYKRPISYFSKEEWDYFVSQDNTSD